MVRRRLPIKRHQPCILQHQAINAVSLKVPQSNHEDGCSPEVVRRQIFSPPHLLTPSPPLHRDLPPKLFMRSPPFSRLITPKEEERIVQVGVIELDRNVVHPWLDSLGEPLRVGGSFEDERARGEEPFEAGRPGVAVDLRIRMSLIVSNVEVQTRSTKHTHEENRCKVHSRP
jgi:hypothetical protein